MAKFIGRRANIEKYLDQVFSFLGYVVVALAVIFLAALLILLLLAAFVADKQSQLWEALEGRKSRR